MASSVKFLSFSPNTFGGLCPAPNVTETADISAVVEADPTPRLEPCPEALQGKELKIITTYRSALLWLEGGVVIHRHAAKTVGANGYQGWPLKELVEEVIVGDWIAEVEFV
jgi:hypothetical protein